MGKTKKKVKTFPYLLPDSVIPSIFFLATGEKLTGWHPATNVWRRFFDIALLYAIGKNLNLKTLKEWGVK